MGVTPEGGVSHARAGAGSRIRRGVAVRDAATAAWLMALPCAAVTVLAVLHAGPWVGHRVIPAEPTFDFMGTPLTPHPREIGRFLVSLAGPVLLALATVVTVRRQPLLPRPLVTGLVVLAQAALIATLGACLDGRRQPAFRREYFTTATLVAAALIALALLLASRSAALRRWLGARAGEARWRRWGLAAAAAALTVVWMLHAVNSDRSIAWSVDVTRYHLAFHMDETFALLNGLTPLATFTPQYGGLWPYAVAPAMLLLGKSLLAYTAAMSAVTSLALLGVFGVLRRVTRNSLTALLLFVPFLATTLFHVGGTMDVRLTYGSYFAVLPLRYAGPLLLAWLTARQLSDPARHRAWPLFAAGGLVVMNNVDFGIAALGATLAALLWTRWPRGRRAWLSLAANVAAGLALALLLVTLSTLVRAGMLPQLDRVSEFARIFGRNGFAAVAIPDIRGLPLIVYLTYAAAIATATVLGLRGERDRVLGGMLAWIGVFGLGSASYYAGRAHEDVLIATFPAWALAIALLAVVALRSLAGRPLRGQVPMALVVLFGLGVTACSIAQIPSPANELRRLREDPTGRESEATPLAPAPDPETRRFVAGIADGPRRFVVKDDAPVAILSTIGHRVADAYGVRNVSPYTGFESILTAEQAERMLDALRDAGGNTVLMDRTDKRGLNRILMRRGFKLVTAGGLRDWPSPDGEQDLAALGRLRPTTVGGYVKWVDTRHLHPRALD